MKEIEGDIRHLRTGVVFSVPVALLLLLHQEVALSLSLPLHPPPLILILSLSLLSPVSQIQIKQDLNHFRPQKPKKAPFNLHSIANFIMSEDPSNRDPAQEQPSSSTSSGNHGARVPSFQQLLAEITPAR